MKKLTISTLLAIALAYVPAYGQTCPFDVAFQNMFSQAGSLSGVDENTRMRLQELIVCAHRISCLTNTGFYKVKKKVNDTLVCFLETLASTNTAARSLHIQAVEVSTKLLEAQPQQELMGGLSAPEHPKGKASLPAKCKCDIVVGTGRSAGVVYGEVTLPRSDLIDLVASCSPSGGTYSWQILNPTEQTTLTRTSGERTKFFSQAAGSFRIKLTYTAPDGSTCEAFTQIRIR